MHQDFDSLFRLHRRAIEAHIRALVPNQADADDVFQETWTTLWQKFDQYQPGTDFRAWACRIAYYNVLKLRDRGGRSPRFFGTEFLDAVSEEMIVMSDRLDARAEALRDCCQKLDSRDRDLLERYYRKGASAKEVAARLGRSLDWVYRGIRRIHDLLFDCIRKRLTEELSR